MATPKNHPDPMASDTSYVEMDRTEDATLIGKHCQLDYCNQLDFLPFHCQSCKKTFCLDHRTEDAHKCENRGAWAERKRQAQLARPSAGAGKLMRDTVSVKPCSDDSCKTVIGTPQSTGVHCDRCNRDYCLKHRLQEDHDCKNKVPIGARPGRDLNAVREQTASTFSKLKALYSAKKKEQTSKGLFGKDRAAQQAANEAMRVLKRDAQGDKRVAPEKRIYLYVEAEAETTVAKIPKGMFFYSRDWVVGRMLDEAARSLQVENTNNRTADEKNRLRVFHVESGNMLEFNEKLSQQLQTGNTVVLLRGIGPPPNLIEL
ncbi:AN1-like zinc finger protein [Microdochium trichocladiopsis]|uniref:AN1-like zinc finger protein n=1 Tax=Microdochium trichocladiopsis TaxID=1682393 RepID=A0A9P8YEK1_9PEZI|nr:AN1-like zinc finger protein [Microdochium trichocladiopsis]KAH7035532.1 AN1-like zinc finger protein [Microdochium trichocladiopsis]